MFRKLMSTDDSVASLIARVALGIVILPHGMQKLLGWFGGSGVEKTIGFFGEALGIPAFLTVLVIAAESFGALGLILGLLSRIGALGVLSVMLGAVFLIHGKVGFFMNWYGFQRGEGFEYHILAAGLAVIVLIKGGGKASLDRVLFS
jgi:putative oxidoreductase